ncbi:hypothetical protein tb265_32790 [Gemmatimonadetes bacterium T265]|nr:hypothetical protein tb265_32790 [Gemmatimonadetes bacterium T265]
MLRRHVPLSAERWDAVMALFEAALDRPAGDRPAFVAAACGGDAALRAEVESLLAADAGAADFLEPPAAPAPDDAAPDLPARLQATLGRAYRVERELAGGGMSRVFVAEEVRLGRRVVVKVLPPGPRPGPGAERFLREARLIASLRHPHIVPLLAAGESADGLLYYTMPYVEGESLQRRLERDGPLPPGEVAAIVREVAGALAYAHAHGVIHRDVKPANVLRDGVHALVADFGIAKAGPTHAGDSAAGTGPEVPAGAPPAGTTLTTAGLVLGTPAYMSPEQARGEPVDARSDVYSLGCVTFELLTGRRPFADADAAALARRAVDRPPAASSYRPDLPAALDSVLARAFAPRPDARYAGAVEFAEALAPLAVGPYGPAVLPAAPGEGGAVGAPARRWRQWSPRRRAAAVLAVAGAAVVAAAAARATLGTPAADDRLTNAGVAAAGGPAAARRTVAVLPFDNVGPPGDAYFADGVTDELASRLTSLAGLRVISPRSTREYRNAAKPPAQIGRELGADYLLQGRARWERAGAGDGDAGAGRVRVSAELVSVRDGSMVWADRYAADAGDVVAVEGAIGERVAAALELALGARARETLAARPTADFEAYTHFLRGEALRTAPTAEAGEKLEAIAEYEWAVARDPTFALAYARLSQVHSRVAHDNVDPSAARRALARATADTAVRLAPALSEAHLALGYSLYYGRRDLDGALGEFTRALALHPGAEQLEARGYVLRRQGRFAEAVADLERAVELEPRSALVAWDLASTYAPMRAFAEALRYEARAIALDPAWSGAYADQAMLLVASRGDTTAARAAVRAGLARSDPARVVARLGVHAAMLLGTDSAARAALRRTTLDAFGRDTAEYLLWQADWARRHGDPRRGRAYAGSARRRLEALVAATPDDGGPHMALSRAFAELGRRDDALREGRRAVALLPVSRDAIDGASLLVDLAYVETIVGAHEAAVAHLAELLAIPSGITVPLLRADPMWDPLRGDLRFQRLVDLSAR